MRRFNILQNKAGEVSAEHDPFELKRALISKEGLYLFWLKTSTGFIFKSFSCNGELIASLASSSRVKLVELDSSHELIVRA